MYSTRTSFTAKEVGDLRKQVASLTEEIRDNKCSFQTSNDQLKKQLGKVQKKLDAQKKENATLRRDVEEEKNQAKEYLQRIKELQAHVKRLEAGPADTWAELALRMSTLPEEAEPSAEQTTEVDPSREDRENCHTATESDIRPAASDLEAPIVALCSQVLRHLDTYIQSTQALILTRTGALAERMQRVINNLGYDMELECHACVGGTNTQEDVAKLQERVHVVFGTPGCVLPMIHRQALHTDHIKVFGLAQADELLSHSFKNQIHEVFQRMPKSTQGVLLSATMPAGLLEFKKKFTREPTSILAGGNGSMLEGIEQFYIPIDNEESKLETVCDVCVIATTQVVVFCNTRRKVDWLTGKMIALEFNASAAHGGIKQAQRHLIMREFRSRSSRVLITTDLLAGDIGLQKASLVINYDLPTSRETYIQHIACVGSSSQKMTVLNFVTTEDMEVLHDTDQFYEIQIDEMPANLADYL